MCLTKVTTHKVAKTGFKYQSNWKKTSPIKLKTLSINTPSTLVLLVSPLRLIFYHQVSVESTLLILNASKKKKKNIIWNRFNNSGRTIYGILLIFYSTKMFLWKLINSKIIGFEVFLFSLSLHFLVFHNNCILPKKNFSASSTMYRHTLFYCAFQMLHFFINWRLGPPPAKCLKYAYSSRVHQLQPCFA